MTKDQKTILAQIAELDYSDCFLPEETQYILEDLFVYGGYLNVYGSEGKGRNRVLEDVSRLAKAFGDVWLLDVKPFRQSYESLLNSLAIQANITTSIAQLKEVYHLLPSSPDVLLILNNLEYISDHPTSGQKKSLDPAYDKAFIAALNEYKNTNGPKVRILVGSHGQLKNIKMHGNYSILEVETRPLKEPGKQDLKRELCRELSGDEWERFFEDNPSFLRRLLEKCLEHTHTYSLIGFIGKELRRGENENMPFLKRIEAFIKDYNKTHALSLERKIDKASSKAGKLARASRIRIPKLNLISLIKGIFSQDDE